MLHLNHLETMKKGEEHIGSRTLTGIKDGDFLKLVRNLPAHAQDHKQVNVNCKAVFPGCFLSWSKLPKGKTHFKKTVVEAFVGHQSSHLFGWGKTKAQIYRYITALTVISAPVAGNFQKETWWFYMGFTMLNQPLKPAPSFCVKTHNRILWSSSSTRCFCISSSKTVGEMARHSKLHNKAPPFLRSDLFTRTWKFRRRTWVGCLLRVYLYLHGIYQYNIYTYVCVCVNILYTHMVTHHCSSNSEKATTQSKADHGKGQPPLAKGDGAPHPPAGWQATQSNDEEPLQRFRKRLPGLPWRNDGAKMRARMAKRKRNWPCVCVCDANSWATYSRTHGAMFCRHFHWLSLFFCKLEETERGSWFAWQLSILPPSNLKS